MKKRTRLFRGPKWLIITILTIVAITSIVMGSLLSTTRLASPKLVAYEPAAKALAKPTTETAPPQPTEQPAVATTPDPIVTPPAATASSDCNPSLTHADPSSIDVLVNKKHCLVPLDYAPADLVTVDGWQVSAKAADSFIAMSQAAAAAGQPISITSSYRSYSTQIITYNYWVSISGASGADNYSARPGFSEHQTGLAIDIGAGDSQLSNFTGSSQAAWLADNAYRYGFIERYPAGYEAITGYEAESWHYRYVGVATATDMHNQGIKTLEQYWGLSGGDYQ